jgi:hypothetical protein
MDLEHILARSRASDPLKAAVRALASHPYGYLHAGRHLSCARPAPAIKALRVVIQLLHAEPGVPFERLWLEGVSGCSDFVGTLTAEAAGAARVFDFTWCCKWRADQEGWYDDWGNADQIRAAREFGWRCFAHWHLREVVELPALGRVAGLD